MNKMEDDLNGLIIDILKLFYLHNSY